MDTPDALIGTGLYPLRQAARLVGADARNVRRWLRGYSWKSRDGRSSSGPLWHLQYEDDEDLGGERVLGFQDLLELRTVAKFIGQGVSLRVIRATIDTASEFLGRYPLQSKRFLTDGKRIFLEAVERSGEDPRLMDIRRRQFVFDAVIRPSLFEGIDYDSHGRAQRWFPVPKARIIVLDPQVQFGEPIVAASGVPTDTLYAAYLAEGKDRSRVAKLYRVTPQAVNAAVLFEQRLAA
ncbi:DUF433 domain-containing protein [Ideonella sp. YS5]|uniref:DUF433 domain-containing protein n=1 Tax=Ideonella sp. YS5 TaxID=3453714 RepID=UPI003EE9A770